MKVLLTGTSSGLGSELCSFFLDRGDTVLGISRKTTKKNGNQQRDTDERFTFLACDLGSEEQIQTAVSELSNKNINFDAVVLNAAAIEDDLIDGKLDYAKLKKIFEINVLGNMNLLAGVLPLVRQRGAIVAVSSLSVILDLSRRRCAYPASKAALNCIFDAFRLKMSGQYRFITVNLGRLGNQAKLPFQVSYRQAASKIIRLIETESASEVINFPWTVSYASRILRHLPPAFSRKYLSD
ncbi:MAG: SDR family NAD(P)-dependent oxidoreductase [Deltaproteobacteria bacterium]|nr:SDR family NAD(P)-dependent oxidoreductase [Deltaproteobacteria bacterium]